MTTPLSTRITGYFAALFVVAMALLFYLWYVGVPQLGVVGASSQRLVEATRILEIQADHKRSLIAGSIRERRGDILVVAEDQLLNREIETDGIALTAYFEAMVERLRRAYPNRYQQLLLINPERKTIIANSEGKDIGAPFAYPALIERASLPGMVELIEQITRAQGPAIAIVRQMHVANAQGYPRGKLVGVLVALLDPQLLVAEGLLDEAQSTGGEQGSTLLFDPSGQLLAKSANDQGRSDQFKAGPQVADGFEGTLIERDAGGVERIVVYRHLPLSGNQGWTLVHHLSTDAAMASVRGNANKLSLLGVVLTLVSLLGIYVAARRLTRPLHSLFLTASRLGSGDLSTRVSVSASDSQEILALSEAFNAMAGNIEIGHQTLESSVKARTVELATERDRAQGYLDIAGVMLLALDRQGRVIMINRRGLEILGHPGADLAGLDWFDNFVPQALRDHIRASFVSFLANNRNTLDNSENAIVDAHGQERLLAWSNTLVLDAQGRAVGTLSSAQDITEQKLADAELRIAAIAFESQEGMYVADANWRILRVNSAFCQLTGYLASEAVGAMPHELLGTNRQDGEFYTQLAASLLAQGYWTGEVWDKRKNGDEFPAWLRITAVRTEDGTTTHYVATVTDITERRATEEEIKSLAFFDPLTNLPNRRLLMDRLEQALTTSARHQRHGAVLFIDLDNFKDLNDTLGHDKGDELLQHVAQRLVACVREGDTVARLGGDEFVVMLEDLSEPALQAATEAEVVGEKILHALGEPYWLAGVGHTSTPSMGVTLFLGHTETLEELLKRADMAMYQAKAAGRNTLRFFDPQMQTVVSERAALETGLRDAVVNHQFILHYQAQVMGERTITGAEVLVRWSHPVRGMVSPAEFIPLAEQTGVILQIGHWVMETACAQLAQWAKMPHMAHLTLSVNVSARQFHHADFTQDVLRVLDSTGANPARLKLELTESLLVSNVADVVAKMTILKSRGVSFSLDDFGTGYSSLSYLKRLPLDQLKIDQGFVRDILTDANDAAIARTVIALAESLGLSVIAEGVETEAQRNALSQQGCQAFQGYLFSRPLPLAGFMALMQN
jgi:diguanylate cyclase (GGDEF)-like protein/PAS domain S-box-containing protein